jgi:hypothetical protein
MHHSRNSGATCLLLTLVLGCQLTLGDYWFTFRDCKAEGGPCDPSWCSPLDSKLMLLTILVCSVVGRLTVARSERNLQLHPSEGGGTALIDINMIAFTQLQPVGRILLLFGQGIAIA